MWCVAWTVYKIPGWCNEGSAQQKGNFRSCIFYIRQLSETHSVAFSLSLSLLHTHTLLQESASMFSKIEFLKIVLGKEAAGNMKAPVEPTTLPAAQRHAPLHFANRAHIHTHTHTTHTHTMCIWQFSLVVAHHQHLLFGTAPNRCSSRCCLFFCIPCKENCLEGCVSWSYKYTLLQERNNLHRIRW